MASNGGMLKDSRVKLFLSSRTEMQKIIEETRQQHLAMQAAATGVPNMASTSAASVQRPFIGGPFAPVTAPVTHINPSVAASVRPASSNSNFHSHMDTSQVHPGGFDRQMYPQQQQQQQSHQPFNQSQRMLPGAGPNQSPVHVGGFPPRMNQPQQQQQQTYVPHLSQGGHSVQHFGPRMSREVSDEPPLGPYGGQQQMHGGPSGEMGHDMYHHGGGGGLERFDRDRRDSRDIPPEVVDRNRDMDRGGYRNRDRGRRDRERDKDRGPDMGRRGRRSRSRSRSGSRGRGRDRRRRSRSDSRERSRTSRDRDRNGKLSSSKSGLLPTPADQMENNQSNEPAPDTSVQLRLLAGDLTYRDIRDYLNGIHVPNTCIKMINAFDGYRFGLAYIRFTTKADKQKALSRHNGNLNETHSPPMFY